MTDSNLFRLPAVLQRMKEQPAKIIEAQDIRKPDLEDLAADVERTRFEMMRAAQLLESRTKAHHDALEAWRAMKLERGLE